MNFTGVFTHGFLKQVTALFSHCMWEATDVVGWPYALIYASDFQHF